jgi:hypothetical protein
MHEVEPSIWLLVTNKESIIKNDMYIALIKDKCRASPQNYKQLDTTLSRSKYTKVRCTRSRDRKSTLKHVSIDNAKSIPI